MKAFIAAAILMLPAFAYAHRPPTMRLTARRAELPRVHSGGGHAGGVTQPEAYNPPKETATAQKPASAQHGS
jgi:hypothetical protein